MVAESKKKKEKVPTSVQLVVSPVLATPQRQRKKNDL